MGREVTKVVDGSPLIGGNTEGVSQRVSYFCSNINPLPLYEILVQVHVSKRDSDIRTSRRLSRPPTKEEVYRNS